MSRLVRIARRVDRQGWRDEQTGEDGATSRLARMARRATGEDGMTSRLARIARRAD